MSGTDEVDDIRLPGRVPRHATRPNGRHESHPAALPEDEDDEDVETVNRLLGFLRNDEP